MITKHFAWVMPSGNEWLICTECGAQVHYSGEDDREIDSLEPELQVLAREDYKAYEDKILGRTRDAVMAHRKRLKDSREKHDE